MKGKLVEVTGADGVGKTTFINALADRLMSEHTVCIRQVLDKQSPITKLIYDVLNGDVTVPKETMHLLFEAGKYEQAPVIRELLESYDFVVMDRYRLENIAYGYARGMDTGWMETVQSGLPNPDVTLILDMDTEKAMKRTGGDLYERDRTMQENVRRFYQAYASLYGTRKNVFLLNADRYVEEIVDDAMDILLSL